MKNLIRKISFVVSGLLCCMLLNAQTVKGVVRDSSGQPVPGVAVMVQGTSTGVSTGLDGTYSIDVPDAEQKSLVFSCIGLKTETVRIGLRSVIDIEMFDDSTFLDETVVIGYATVKRRDLMGSVTSVDNKTLTATPVNNVAEALTGRMAGVQVTTTEGNPDADVKIRVRGAGSITQDSSPLYIVDGFPVSSINDIPAADIQSIDVLKDAFSTAIYGSRGANGVVLVTTKGGSDGKVSVSYNAYYGRKKMAHANAIEVMSPYEFVRTQYELAMMNDKYEEQFVQYFGAFQDMDLYKGVKGNDYLSNVFGNIGTTVNHNISVSGGSDKVKWTGSYSHIGDDAIMTGSSYRRDNLSFKTQYKPVKQLTFDINARYSSTRVRGAGANSINDTGSSSSNGRLKHSVQYTPIPIIGVSTDSDLEDDVADNAPPLVSIADNDTERNRSNWTINGAVTWHIVKNLNLKVEGGLDDYNQEDNHFYGLTTYYVTKGDATYKNQPANFYKNAFRKTYRSTNTLSYNFGDVFQDSRHKLDLLAGQEYILSRSNLLSSTVEAYPDFFDSNMAWHFMESGTTVKSNNFYNPDDQLLSFFGRVNYDFDGRYAFSATFRTDGSSKFTKGNQWGFFPSAAASWTISNEPWMQGAGRWMDNLKLRYSYGTAGNNNIPSGVSTMTYEASSTTYVAGTSTYWAPKKADGKVVMPNSNLTWETTISHNLGLDFSFFRSRLSGSVEAYSNTTDNLLVKFPTQGSGYDYQYRNLGVINNSGYELTLNVVLVEKKNCGLSAGGNISINKNVVKSLGGLSTIETESRWCSSEIGVDYVVEEGQPLGNIYGYKCAGRYGVDEFSEYKDGKWISVYGEDYDKSVRSIIGTSYYGPGALKLEDINDMGRIDSKDKTVIGNTLPLGVGGFNLSGFAYGFDFSANFNYVFGNSIYNANKIEFTSSRKYYRRNLMKCMETGNRWTNIDWETGELVTDLARLGAMNSGTTMWSPGIQNGVLTDWAVEDGSFLRLSSATVGYTIPEKVSQKIHMQRLRVYVTGSNLFCLTNYSGYDPEVDTRRDTPLTPGIDCSAYPKSIGFVAGVNVTF